MPVFTVSQVLDSVEGHHLMFGPANEFTGVSHDTRTLIPGDLFVAIRGERFDGHKFLDAARERGAAGALVQELVPGVHHRVMEPKPGAWHIIEVTDTLYALGRLARSWRRRFSIPVIGITGSAGKTTTKEMTAAILEQRWPTLKSQGNYNNEIGLPLTIFSLTPDHQVAVLEFGMRGRGQIGYLAAVARPTIGVITNIGLTHLELLGSQKEIILAKAELLDEMPTSAIAVLPRHDASYQMLAEHVKGRLVTVGTDKQADFWVSNINIHDNGCARFNLHYRNAVFPIKLAIPGRHQVWNALTAAAAAITAGAVPDEVQRGLGDIHSGTGRMQIVDAPRGFTVIDDSYNANPAAMRATLEYLAEAKGRRKIAILGDMLELGYTEVAIHREIGQYAMELGVDALLAVGVLGREYVTGANDNRAQWFPSHESAIQAALDILQPGDVALVKGSHAMKMDEIVTALLK